LLNFDSRPFYFAKFLFGFIFLFLSHVIFSVETFRRLRTATSIFEKLLDQKTFIDL